jgi:hypothetical protein
MTGKRNYRVGPIVDASACSEPNLFRLCVNELRDIDSDFDHSSSPGRKKEMKMMMKIKMKGGCGNQGNGPLYAVVGVA